MKTFAPVFLAVLLAGCASAGKVVPQPSKITLESAMESVGKSFNELRRGLDGLKLGMVPSEVVVTFNVTAGGEDSSKLYVELTPAAVAEVAKAGVDVGSKLSTSRGNQITIRLSNIFLAADKTLITSTKDAAEIERLVHLVQQYGMMVKAPESAPH